MESEAFRDSVLLASGAMAHRMHGPPVPVKEDGVGQIVLGAEMLDGERKPTGKQESFEGAARRSIYVQVRRTRPLAVLESFDIATNTPNCTVRNFSNVAKAREILGWTPAVELPEGLRRTVADFLN